MNKFLIKSSNWTVIFSAVVIWGLVLFQISCVETQRSGKITFEKSRQVWNKSGIKDYKMKISIGAGGHAAPSGDYIITVRGGKTVSIVRPDEPSIELSDYYGFNQYNDLDKIFTILEGFFKSASENKQMDQLSFDSKLGYPKIIKLNFDPRELHGGFYFEVIEFEVLK
jgi:hypothetical protein